ncbi:MAG: PolC-type DNA polymerase III [Syntrophomonas sp.]
MKRDFYAFLDSLINTKVDDVWKDAQLERLEVHREQGIWRFFVNIQHPIPNSILQATILQIKSELTFLNGTEIISSLMNPSVQIKKILAVRHDDIKKAVFPHDGDLVDALKWQICDARIDLSCPDFNSYNRLIEQEICNHLSTWFWQEYSLRVLARALCREKNPFPKSALKFIPQGEASVLENIQPVKSKKRSAKKNGRELSEKENCLKVSELQEGLQSAVVEGEIWAKEVNVLKDKRLVVSYYLTDYTDTIVVKTFVDREEDLEIEVGHWVRVSGSVRYDSFVKEAVLFMYSYLIQARPERLDDCQDKRIELHAHTKMSAMDGLTEIKELINRAAGWGHPAIAITDHGCLQAFPDAFKAARKNGIKLIYGVEAYLVEENKKERSYHIVLLAKNQAGLKNLYYLVSKSYLDHFYRHPKMPRKELLEHREGLLLGSACEAGELYQALINGEQGSRLREIADFYDYLEIQPLANNEFLIKDGKVDSVEDLQNLNREIINLGKEMNKPVVATGDVHFLDPHHEVFRKIVQAGQGYEDAESQAPLYLRTTGEMLHEFAYLGEREARQVVVEGPAYIAGMVEDINPIPHGFYPPKIEGAEEEIKRLSWERARMLYGNEIPEEVEKRINRELDSIIGHGFSVLYLIAHKLVQKSNSDGYTVGSRGSVGSSLVAYLTGVTEVNPLAPHYLCPACSYSEFFFDGSAACGVDLEDKVCPHCGTEMRKDGFDIPFETFLGFKGEKVPDIDLNFSGDYQSRAHQYVEELFGKENVFRAGTISTIAEKTAYGFVKKYAEARQMDIKGSEINRLVKGITGVRRTTGQHPGGLIVVPADKDVLEFCPLQYPADNKDAGIITTHFEYHAMEEQLVKLDILGHDGPTVIKELEDLTGANASSINLSDRETMKIFSGVEPLRVNPEDIASQVGTYGIPEFGTRFVRQMLEATRPTTFSELVRICGLSHGTNVWLNNAQTLIEDGTARLNQVICTRDDIMTYLIQQGVDKTQAFSIMESVRKGKGLKDEQEELLQDHQVPEWYIQSCQKIEYMFPKAHAVAYVILAFRIAYFKVYYPLAFYASFFSIRAEDFDYQTILSGYDAIRKRIKELERDGMSASQKDKKLIPILELAMEMYARGFNFLPVDIYLSDASKFLVSGQGLLLPFSALPNVGVAAAQGIVDSRDGRDFISVEDFQQRTRLNKTAMDVLRNNQCFKGLPETTQISLFA